jgi:O-antigen/teichoic acid export membrane protein
LGNSLGGYMTLRRALAWFAATYVFATGGYFATQALAGRMLGVGSYGRFATATTAAVFVGQLGSLGLQRSGLRSTAREGAVDSSDLITARQALRAVSAVILPAIALVSGVVIAALLASNAIAVVTASIAVLIYGLSYTTLAAGFLRGSGRIVSASVLEGRSGGALMAMSQSAVVVAFRLVHPHRMALSTVLFAVAIGSVPATVYAGWRLARLWPVPVPRVSLPTGVRLAKIHGGVFAGIQAAGMLNAQVETWIATALLTAASASRFASGQRLSLLVVLPLTASQVVVAPALSRLHAEGDHEATKRLLRSLSTFSVVLAALVTIPMIIVPGHILSVVFGANFAAGGNTLRVLAIGPLVMSAFGISSMALAMSGEERVVWHIQGSAAVIRVVLGTLAAVLFGAPGLAVSATLVTVGSWLAIGVTTRTRLNVPRVLTLRPSIRVLAQH